MVQACLVINALLDTGMHVPLLVRFPEKWQHLAPDKPGKETSRMVSFVDFAPSVLRITATPIPSHMQGQPVLEKISRKKENMSMVTAIVWMKYVILPVQLGMKNTYTSGTTCPILDTTSRPHGRILAKSGMNSTNLQNRAK